MEAIKTRLECFRCPAPGPKEHRNLFEEMMGRQDRMYINADGEWVQNRPRSLWALFLDAIQRHPTLSKLKTVIDRANEDKDTFEQQ